MRILTQGTQHTRILHDTGRTTDDDGERPIEKVV